MITKSPPFYDISHWKEVEDFSKVSPRPLLFGTKATEGTNFVDGKFVRFFEGMKSIGVKRLAYHFHRKAANPIDQAKHFINTIKPHITAADVLALDVEEGGETAAQLRAFCEYVMAALPRNMFWIYSRRNILESIPTFLKIFPHMYDLMSAGKSALDDIQMTLAEREFFRAIPTWIAGYPNNPDLYSSIPSFYVPDQNKWGPPFAWQYSPKGQITGIQGDVDLNWLAPIAIALLNGTPSTPDVITQPYPGLKRISGVRHGWNFELFISDPSKVRYEAVCLAPLDTVSRVRARHGATLAVNGGEWDRETSLKDYAVSNGGVCHARVTAAPSLMVTSTNAVIIDHKPTANVKQALSGLRYLIEDGVIKRYLYDPSDPLYEVATATEGHARSIHGVTAQGYHMVMQSEGVYPNQGLTLKQCAEVMKQYGAVIAFDSGGGGDVSCNFDGESLIVPENITNGVHHERPLPQVFLIYAGGTSMVNGTAIEKLGNTSKIRSAPSRYGTDMGSIAPGSTIEFVQVVPVQVGGTADNPNDKWFELPGGGKYVNYILSGIEYYTILTQPTTDPEPEPEKKPERVDITLVAGSTVTTHYSDGTSETETA